ncbi:MAG: hypothetical protein HPY55_00645 [Firmicutes bacterium]|nr:hypothetical protein [Bacillota bacterium]
MTLSDIKHILQAEVLYGEDNLDSQVVTGCAADLMSDVLAFGFQDTIVITGLVNEQVILTAEMIDAAAVLFVRGKARQVSGRVLELAREKGIPVLVTNFLMFESCGLLYGAGLKACRYRDVQFV